MTESKFAEIGLVFTILANLELILASFGKNGNFLIKFNFRHSKRVSKYDAKA